MRTRLERLGLIKTTVPAETHAVFVRRIDSVKQLHLRDGGIESLPERINRFGVDCYLQGLIDGAGLGARNPTIVEGG